MAELARQWGCIALSSVILQCAWLGCQECAHAATADEAAAPAKAAVTSKLALLTRMLEVDRIGDRIVATRDAEAIAKLDSARLAQQRAVELMARGEFNTAEQSANDALRLIREAMRPVSSKTREEARLRADYQARLEQVRGFHAAYDRIQAEKSRARGGVLDEASLSALVTQSEQRARDGHYEEATQLLTRASTLLETALTRLRDKQTLVHELKFASEEDELRYEQDRNHSYVLLLELVISERKAEASAREAARRAIDANGEARAQAQEAAQRADLKGALRILEGATTALTQALRLAGVPLP